MTYRTHMIAGLSLLVGAVAACSNPAEPTDAADAAEAMKVTAQDLLALNVIDRIVPEPVGGAHRDPQAAAESLAEAVGNELDQLGGKSAGELRRIREERFLQIGSA